MTVVQARKRLSLVLKKVQLVVKPQVPCKEANLLWVGTRSRMARINRQARGKNQPTDVLSFPAPKVFQKQGFLGELVICVPVLREQAREQGHSIAEELDILLVHGVLHLLGYDHERGPAAARKMAKMELKILSILSNQPSYTGLIQRNS